MSIISIHHPHVKPLPTSADGLIVPRLIPVAAHLCCADYDDTARSEVLEALAAGATPIELVERRLLEWADLAPIVNILRGRAPYAEPVAPRPAPVLVPITGGAPMPDDLDWEKYGAVPKRLPIHDAIDSWRRGDLTGADHF